MGGDDYMQPLYKQLGRQTVDLTNEEKK